MAPTAGDVEVGVGVGIEEEGGEDEEDEAGGGAEEGPSSECSPTIEDSAILLGERPSLVIGIGVIDLDPASDDSEEAHEIFVLARAGVMLTPVTLPGSFRTRMSVGSGTGIVPHAFSLSKGEHPQIR